MHFVSFFSESTQFRPEFTFGRRGGRRKARYYANGKQKGFQNGKIHRAKELILMPNANLTTCAKSHYFRRNEARKSLALIEITFQFDFHFISFHGVVEKCVELGRSKMRNVWNLSTISNISKMRNVCLSCELRENRFVTNGFARLQSVSMYMQITMYEHCKTGSVSYLYICNKGCIMPNHNLRFK